VFIALYCWTGYQEKIPFVKSAPIEVDDASKTKKKQVASGGGTKSTAVDKVEHPGGDTPGSVADGISNVTLKS